MKTGPLRDAAILTLLLACSVVGAVAAELLIRRSADSARSPSQEAAVDRARAAGISAMQAD